MTRRCTHCGGSLFAELVESLYVRGDAPTVVLVCSLCARSPDEPPPILSSPEQTCSILGCLRRAGSTALCGGHLMAHRRRASGSHDAQ